jgi:hypothetical protein
LPLELLELVKDEAWLANKLSQHWQTKNAAKQKHLTGEVVNVHSRSANAGLS